MLQYAKTRVRADRRGNCILLATSTCNTDDLGGWKEAVSHGLNAIVLIVLIQRRIYFILESMFLCCMLLEQLSESNVGFFFKFYNFN